MRLKVLSLILLPGLCALGFSACTPCHPKSAVQTQPAVAAQTDGTPFKSNTISLAIVATNGETTNISAATDPEHVKYVHETIARLETLQMNNDPDSLNAILAEMKNPDQQIRAAALSATIQFDDRSVIPKLQEIAAQTEDPHEKAEILKAIDYMKLPSLTEFMAQQRALKAAMRTNPPALSPAPTNTPQPAPSQP